MNDCVNLLTILDLLLLSLLGMLLLLVDHIHVEVAIKVSNYSTALRGCVGVVKAVG